MTTSSSITKPVTIMLQKNFLTPNLRHILTVNCSDPFRHKGPYSPFYFQKKILLTICSSVNIIFENLQVFIGLQIWYTAAAMAIFPTLDCILLTVKFFPQSILASQWSGTCCHKHSHTTCCYILLEKEHSKKMWSLDSHLFLQNPHNKFPCQPHLTNLSKVKSLSWIANQKINACFGMIAASQSTSLLLYLRASQADLQENIQFLVKSPY